MTVDIKWQGITLTLEGEYDPPEPEVGYTSGEFCITEVWYTPKDGSPERQRALEDCDGEVYVDLCELGLQAIENDKGGFDYD